MLTHTGRFVHAQWGPLNLLTWLSLKNPKYRDVPRVSSARKGLCGQALAAVMVEWEEERHVHENLDATTAQVGQGIHAILGTAVRNQWLQFQYVLKL